MLESRVVAKKTGSEVRSAKNVIFSLLRVLLDRPMGGGGGLNPQNSPLRTPLVTRECNPKILVLVYLFLCSSMQLQQALISVSWNMKHISFDRAYFYFCSVISSCKPMQCALKTRFRRSRIKSLAHSRQPIFQFPIVANSSAWLHLSIQFM